MKIFLFSLTFDCTAPLTLCESSISCLCYEDLTVSPPCLQIGTYQMAVCSKAHNKPFYVVAESFKFVRLYPLNQQDVPDKFKVRRSGEMMLKLRLKLRRKQSTALSHSNPDGSDLLWVSSFFCEFTERFNTKLHNILLSLWETATVMTSTQFKRDKKNNLSLFSRMYFFWNKTGRDSQLSVIICPLQLYDCALCCSNVTIYWQGATVERIHTDKSC